MKIFEVTARVEDNVERMLQQYCAPYLNEIGGLHNALVEFPLYRGVGHKLGGSVMKVPVHQFRAPRDTKSEDHRLANDWFQKKFSVRYRGQSLFCSGSRHTADAYSIGGQSAIVLPVGNYSYCWSQRYFDMNTDFEDGDSTDIIEFLADGDYINTGIHKAIRSRHEVMLHCQEAMLVSIEWVEGEYEIL